jgi:hypothetical protein
VSDTKAAQRNVYSLEGERKNLYICVKLCIFLLCVGSGYFMRGLFYLFIYSIWIQKSLFLCFVPDLIFGYLCL